MKLVIAQVLLFFVYLSNAVNICSEGGTIRGRKYNLLCWLPVPMKSHQKLVEPLLRELASKGHSITLVTPMPMKDPPKSLEQVVISDHYENLHKMLTFGRGQGFFSRLNLYGLKEAYLNYSESLLVDPAVQRFILEERQFDCIIMCVMMNDAFVGLHHRYNAPIIEVLPLGQNHWSYSLYGIPYDTSYIVDTMAPFTDHMTFFQRVHNTALSLFLRGVSTFIISSSEELMNKHLRYPGWEQRPTHKQMIQNISLVLINSNPSINYPYPLPPHAKEIAGASIPPLQPLPKDLQEFMDSASDGVILVSMGSHIDMKKVLGQEKSEIFINFFNTIKQKVIWKWDSERQDMHENVKTCNWLPQNDILAHKNCRLFISHCGFHSSLEAIYHAVPMLAIPVQGDQTKNTVMMEHYKVARHLSLDNITSGSLAWTVNEVLNNNMYKENMLKRSKIFKDEKETALERAVYWIEYVLRHDGAHHLKPVVVSMPWYQQALLDVYMALTLLFLLPIMLFYYIFKRIIQCILPKKSDIKAKKYE